MLNISSNIAERTSNKIRCKESSLRLLTLDEYVIAAEENKKTL
jgi:hypothetical protein